jgi:LacI family transcriptional regulator
MIIKERNITIHDLAREMGLSSSTISRALNDNPRISLSTRQSVRKLAEKYNYLPNSVATSLRKGKSNTLGIIVPNINRSFFSEIISGVEEIISQAGYNLMICQSNESLKKEKEALSALINARVDGILMSLSMETNEYNHIRQAIERDFRMIFFDRIPEGLDVNSVVIDDYSAAFEITKKILNMGYKRPAHIGGAKDINVYANRRKGFLDAVSKKGIRIDSDYIIEASMTREGGRQSFKKLLHLKERPDAYICSGDLVAHGVILAASENNIRIPEDIAVSGFANEDFTSHIRPSLTSVDQKGRDIGIRVAKMFLDTKNQTKCRQSIVDPTVIFRESTYRC